MAKPAKIIQIAVTDEWVFALYDDGTMKRCVASMVPEERNWMAFITGVVGE